MSGHVRSYLGRLVASSSMTKDEMEALRREVEALPVNLPEDVIEGGLGAMFKAKLLALCHAALTLGTPIHF